MKALENFDFDEWAALAASDPATFEAKRQAVLEERIGAIPDAQSHVRESLRAMLFAEQRADATPLDRAVSAFNLMQGAVVQLVEAHAQLAGAVAGQPDERLRIPAAQRFTEFVAKK